MKINVYGTGVNAVKYILYCKRDIACVITGDEDNKIELLGLTVKKLSDALDILKARMTVIATSEESFWEIKKKLEKLGLLEFENFVYYKVFQKKVAIIYGNCHTAPIKQMLENTMDFTKKYGFYPLPHAYQIANRGGWNNYGFEYLEHCELFIHQSIRDNNIYGIEYSSNNLIKYLNPKCVITTIPNTYRMPRFLFPQMEQYLDEYTHEGLNYFPFRDFFIDANVHTKTSQEMANAIVNDDTIYSRLDIINGYESFLMKLRKRELEWDIKMSEFIQSNIKDKHLYYDMNHPTQIYNEYVYNKLCENIGVEKNNDWYYIRRNDLIEIPMYACVRHALGLNYKVKEIRKTGFKLNQNPMDILEYVKEYVCWHFTS